MKKIFMLLMIAGSTVMFTACGGNNEGTVVETDTVDVSTETTYEVERTTVEVDTTVETETVEVDTTLQR